MNVQEPWFSLLISGIKKIEGRLAKPKWELLKTDKTINISCGDKEHTFYILDIRRYASIEEFLSREGIQNVLPGVESIQDGVNMYRQWYSAKDVKKYGFLAIHVKPL